jgi:hypothetical protein
MKERLFAALGLFIAATAVHAAEPPACGRS